MSTRPCISEISPILRELVARRRATYTEPIRPTEPKEAPVSNPTPIPVPFPPVPPTPEPDPYKHPIGK